VPHRGWQLRIADIIEAIETILNYSAGMTFEQFASDRKTTDAGAFQKSRSIKAGSSGQTP
jgi:uncharacterized protein with HEPN domain